MRSTRTLRMDLPNAVWDRLAAEAQTAGVPVGRFARDLFVARDKRKYPTEQVLPGSTAPTEEGDST